MKRGGSGVKVTNWLVIYTCKCLGISSALIETCFIDNKADMVKIPGKQKESVARAFVDGIAERFQLKANSTEQKPGNKPAEQQETFQACETSTA